MKVEIIIKNIIKPAAFIFAIYVIRESNYELHGFGTLAAVVLVFLILFWRTRRLSEDEKIQKVIDEVGLTKVVDYIRNEAEYLDLKLDSTKRQEFIEETNQLLRDYENQVKVFIKQKDTDAIKRLIADSTEINIQKFINRPIFAMEEKEYLRNLAMNKNENQLNQTT